MSIPRGIVRTIPRRRGPGRLGEAVRPDLSGRMAPADRETMFRELRRVLVPRGQGLAPFRELAARPGFVVVAKRSSQQRFFRELSVPPMGT